MQSLAIIFVVVLCASSAVAQSGNSDHCEVQWMDITGKKPEQFEGLKGMALGSFDTVIAEEQLTTKIFRLPKTPLFVIASVWYTDESLASEKGADSVSLELMISKSRKRDLVKALYYADSELPYADFDVARVTNLVKS